MKKILHLQRGQCKIAKLKRALGIHQDGNQHTVSDKLTDQRQRNHRRLKTEILETCDERNDDWAAQVQIRVTGAVSDLHAADDAAM